jgi:CxxC motif-containing protein
MTRLYSLCDRQTGKEIVKAWLSKDAIKVAAKTYDVMPCVCSRGMWFGLDEIRAMRRARQGR